MIEKPRGGWFTQTVSKISNIFLSMLPEGKNLTNTTDTSLVIKTSPSIWEYEMFKTEWDRRSILRDIDLIMKSDPRVKRANRLFASTAVGKGITVTATSTVSEKAAEEAQEVINQIMRDCQVNSKLNSWARILLKDGDLFLNPVVDLATMTIKNIKRLPSVSMQREDDMTGNFPDLKCAFRQVDPISMATLDEFPLWAINHIRWDHEEGDRYGNSQYLQIRTYWKKLDMTEQDLIVRRRTRAIPRRLHSIGNRDNPGNWAQVEEYKSRNQLNPRTAQVTTDFYGNGLVDIKDLNADAHLDQIKDIEHLQEVYMIGTGVPLHILGFGRNVNRDIVRDQLKQFKEETQELRTLLENGDSSAYSGLRYIFDFGLALAGINPLLIDYSIRWYVNENETANERLERVIKMRSVQPKPMVSQKTALSIIAKDIGLENETAISAEINEIDSELEDKLTQDFHEGDELSAAADFDACDPVISRSAKAAMDAAEARKEKPFFPLHGLAAAKLEKRMADDIRQKFWAVYEAMQPELKKIKASFNKLSDKDKKVLIDKLGDIYRKAAASSEKELEQTLLGFYADIAKSAEENVLRQHKKAITDDFESDTTVEKKFKNPKVQEYFQSMAGEEIKKMDETTKDRLRETLYEAYTEGKSWDEWEKRISDVVGGDKPPGRVETIARTELAVAYSYGLTSTYAEIGVEQVQWLAIIDKQTCSECASRNGQTFPLSEVQGKLPLHPRCRCTIVGVYDNSPPQKNKR